MLIILSLRLSTGQREFDGMSGGETQGARLKIEKMGDMIDFLTYRETGDKKLETR
jgi:hypothetical protein